MELSGKTALITGGGSGIGLGIALALAREGCRVAISGRNEEKLREAADLFEGQPILTRTCDVSDRADVTELFAWFKERLGIPDILVNSAGINIPNRQFSALGPDDWDHMLAVNATGAFNCIFAIVPEMRKRRSGLIINISSTAGKRAMKLTGAAYCASKFAMSALGTTVGLEERENGIHVTNIYPGEVNTPILEQRPSPVPDEKKARMLFPEDIAALVVTIAKLHPRALVPELVITPLYQEFS
jgi:NAD(P)-dependent dehydrogenase (short-subunit alcohol dehydrogenase family)